MAAAKVKARAPIDTNPADYPATDISSACSCYVAKPTTLTSTITSTATSTLTSTTTATATSTVDASTEVDTSTTIRVISTETIVPTTVVTTITTTKPSTTVFSTTNEISTTTVVATATSIIRVNPSNTCADFFPCPTGVTIGFQLQVFGFNGNAPDCNHAIFRGSISSVHADALTVGFPLANAPGLSFELDGSTLNVVNGFGAFALSSPTSPVAFQGTPDYEPEFPVSFGIDYATGNLTGSASPPDTPGIVESIWAFNVGDTDRIWNIADPDAASSIEEIGISAVCPPSMEPPSPGSQCPNLVPCASGATSFQVMAYDTGTPIDCTTASTGFYMVFGSGESPNTYGLSDFQLTLGGVFAKLQTTLLSFEPVPEFLSGPACVISSTSALVCASPKFDGTYGSGFQFGLATGGSRYFTNMNAAVGQFDGVYVYGGFLAAHCPPGLV
jgi:hypothetical protein